jgi:hypothetical protein
MAEKHSKQNFYLDILVLFCLSIFFFYKARSQPMPKQVSEQQQFWFGYMTSGKINEKWSLWNDFHYVPDGFIVFRTGLSRKLIDNLVLTSGYAYLQVPTQAGNKVVARNEHRPWGQFVVNHKVSNRLFMVNRLRYDMRFRQDFDDLGLNNNFVFNHRVRWLISTRFPFQNTSILGATPFLNLTNETLVNFGKSIVYNHLDQNRIWLNFGLQFKNISVQLGYMNRYVQLVSGYQFVMNHTAVFWISHNFSIKKKTAIISEEEEDQYYRQP